MKKSASIDYAKIQINTQKTTATATTTTTTTTVTKKLIFKSRQTAAASGNDEETKKIFTTDTSNTETAPTTKKFALKRLQKCDSEGAESKRPRGATIEFTDSDVDDDVTVFEMINTEKARLAKEARNGSDVKAPTMVDTKKNDVTAKKKTNGKVVRSASIKEEAAVVEKAVEKVAEPLPAKVITNGRKNSSNSAAENNGHVNGTKATVNKKILLKRSSKNELYSEEDEIQSPLETTKKPEKLNLKTSPPPTTTNNNVNHEEENRKSGGGKNSKIKLKITDSDVEDPIDVKTTPSPTAKTRRSSTGSNKSSPTPAKKSPKQKQLLDETKLTLNETIISGTCGSMQFGLVKESTTTSLISTVVTTAVKADSSGCGSESLVSNTSATLVMPRINRSDDDDDDDDLDDKQNVKKFKLNIKRDLNAAAKSPPVAQTTTTTTNAVVIKNRIFNSKQSQNPSQNVAAKSSKISGFKIVFNEDDDENSNDVDEEEIIRENKTNANEIDHKSSKSSHKHEQQHSSNHQSSQRNNMGVSAASSSSSSKNATEEIHLRNPRRAFECEELGEAQAFLDDLNYLIGGLGSSHRLSERCLSLVKLAEQCLSSEFRMSLRSSLLPGSSNADNTSVYYLNKLFDLLSDATKYKSLSLCTCLIIYELTQDKLSVEIDQSLFNLVLEIVNEFTSSSSSGESSDEEFIATHLNDIPLSSMSTKASRSSSGCSSMTSSPSNPLHQRHQSAHIGELDGDETDDLIVYKKVSAKCRKLFEKISPLFSAASASLNQTTTPSPPQSVIAGAHNQVEINFCTSLLSLDCLLNLNKNTRNLLFLNETYKAQLRETRVIEKLITRVRFISELMHSSANLVDPLVYAIDRYIQCLSLLQTITQAPQQSAQQQQQQPKKKLLSICYDSDSPTPEFVLNQNYLIEFRDGFFIDILKKTLETCYEQLIIQHQKKTSRATNRAGKTPSPPPTSDDQPSKSNLYAMLTNLVKDVYLLLINTTHNNEANCEKLASDKELLDISIKLMLLDSIGDATCHIADEMKFDVQIMILGFLINLFVNSLQKKSVVSLVNYKNKKLNMSLLDAILKIYLAKEALVQLAEDDHQNELEKINEQIESQNVENINAAIMNSIHRAGRHMEDHIIAAHAALIIGYLLINDRYFNQDQRRFKVESIRDKIKDRSFQVMAQIIRKFVVFMNIMKVGGFSADEHIEIILKHLDEFDIE